VTSNQSRRIAVGTGVPGLAYVLFYYFIAFRFDTKFTVIGRQVDSRQRYKFPPLIRQHLQYISVASDQWTPPSRYLPSAVAIFLPLSVLPQRTAFAFWILLQAASLGGVTQTLARRKTARKATRDETRGFPQNFFRIGGPQ
jgi:hypothetical protein